MTKELHTGTGGNGNAIWLVATIAADGAWQWVERFDSKAEAEAWIKWS